MQETGGHARHVFGRVYHTWQNNQTSVTLPLVLIPVGILSIIFGEAVSRAFSNIGGNTVIRIMGILMLVGGTLIVISVIKGNALHEVLGLTLTALGTAVYSIGVVLGLGLGGVVAGLGFLGITLTFLGRIYLILKSATVQDRLDHRLL